MLLFSGMEETDDRDTVPEEKDEEVGSTEDTGVEPEEASEVFHRYSRSRLISLGQRPVCLLFPTAVLRGGELQEVFPSLAR